MKRMQWTMAILLPAAMGLSACQTGDLKSRLEVLGAEEKTKAIALLAKHQDALIQVEVVLNLTVTMVGQPSRTQERKVLVPGTMIDANGLTVISAGGIDVSRQGIPPNVQAEVQILKAKLILNDGTEVPARVALKDVDLDLAFVLPEEADREFAFVPLDREATVKVLDEVVVLSRMDPGANRTPLIQGGLISGIIEKPRQYYVGPQAFPGNPAFNGDERCFGIFLRRLGSEGVLAEVVILPAAEVLDAAAQVKLAALPAEPPKSDAATAPIEAPKPDAVPAP